MKEKKAKTGKNATLQGKRWKWRVPRRYRLTFVNENTLTSVWSIAMGWKRVVISLSLIVLAVICVGAMLISFTPLRTLLPGYLQHKDRMEYVEASASIDSLRTRVAVNEYYLNNINDILSGRVSADSEAMSKVTICNDSLMATSEEEKEFVRSYREREGFTLDNENVPTAVPVFVAPLHEGVMTSGGKTPAYSFEGVDAPVEVYATARAVVVDNHGDAATGYTLLLQHPNGYLSRYAGLSEAYFETGQTVSSGARIGKYDIDGERDFTYQLLLDGNPQPVEDYIHNMK